MTEALSICAQRGQAKVTRAQMETARAGPAPEDKGHGLPRRSRKSTGDAHRGEGGGKGQGTRGMGQGGPLALSRNEDRLDFK